MAIGKTNAYTISGSTPPETGDFTVRYFDIDGTLLKTQLVNSGQNATPPSNPNYDNSRLTFFGWNFSSTSITQNTDIGAIYNTTTGHTYLDIVLTTIMGYQPTLYLYKENTSTLNVYKNSDNTLLGTSSSSGAISISLNLSAIGIYTLRIECAGGYRIGQGTSSSNAIFGSGNYKNCLKNLRLGINVTQISQYGLYDCYNLQTIAINNNLTSFGSGSLSGCFELKSINIPIGITEITTNQHANNLNLKQIIISNTVITINNGGISGCVSLEKIFIPNLVTTINDGAFSGDYSLREINGMNGISTYTASMLSTCFNLIKKIPNNVTRLLTSCMVRNYNMNIIDVPSSVTQIFPTAFQYCNSTHTFIIRRTTPPTLLATDAFTGINSHCKIYVPDASVTSYKTATNWSTYANYIYPLSDIE